ncbi:dienelactone hydrolase family protein [Paraburkholderia sp. LEh10]|uniref:alpha/beta hydrolase n=1 Tax=Paraburkholderia sp. LEh10 TaxID=2821353 RepID=UPI001AE5460E|nr:dienelactone hydrolase family protein [Paraburkholderia sp. LEh10]MBP0595266.1 dienelactone hydrolase family protein [Paraburkholderia sp. LEh10]
MAWEQFDNGWRLAPAEGRAAALVVLLHGVGSNARDLVPLADIWREALPHAAFASLDGSEPFDGGFGGRQWFSLRDIDEDNRQARVAAAWPALQKMLDAELAHWRLDYRQLALVGFSQGSMMSLHHVATNPQGAAAVVAFSGRLASPVTTRSATPVTLIHGDDDAVIPVDETERAAITLHNAGFEVEAFALPGVGHTISGEGVALGREALTRALAPLAHS